LFLSDGVRFPGISGLVNLGRRPMLGVKTLSASVRIWKLGFRKTRYPGSAPVRPGDPDRFHSNGLGASRSAPSSVLWCIGSCSPACLSPHPLLRTPRLILNIIGCVVPFPLCRQSQCIVVHGGFEGKGGNNLHVRLGCWRNGGCEREKIVELCWSL